MRRSQFQAIWVWLMAGVFGVIALLSPPDTGALVLITGSVILIALGLVLNELAKWGRM